MSIDHSTAATPRSTTSGSTTFSALTTLPTCAQACALIYIDEGFNCDANDLSCLCSTYSKEGYTLGEIALVCLEQQCSNPSDSQRGDAYNLCVGQAIAVVPTHTVLLGLPETTSTSGSNLAASEAAPATTTTRTHISAAAETSSPMNTQPASSLSEQKPGGSTTLSTSQAVGISIAALGVVIITIVGFYLSAYLRRRKVSRHKDQRHSYDFVDNAPLRFSPFKHGFGNPHGTHDFATRHCELPSEVYQTAWSAVNTSRPHTKQFQARQDWTDRTARSISLESPRSDCSTRTISQLLPERPGSRPPQPPLKPQRLSSEHTPAAVFEEERRPAIPRALYPGLPAHPAAFKSQQPQYANQYGRSLERAELLALSLTAPGKPYTVREAVGSTDFVLLSPLPAMTSTPNDRCDSADSSHRSSSHSLLKYYAGVDSGSPDDLYSATLIEEQTQVRRPPPAAITVTKPVYPPRAVRTSTASDASRRTSFESTDPDEPTPPDEEDKRLTPVAESPIAAIRYPKVPRSSAQSVPRSPNHQRSPKSVEWAANRYQVHDGQVLSRHSPSPSGSRLAAKRRGNTAQQDLELGLKIHDSAHASQSRINSQHSNSASQKIRSPNRPEASLKGYGRVTNRVQRDSAWPLPNAMQVRSPPLRSPLWERKLTPRRDGDDLYLNVSIATPMDAHFRR